METQDPGKKYSADNPFVQKTYSADNPFVSQPKVDHPIEEKPFFSSIGDYARNMFMLVHHAVGDPATAAKVAFGASVGAPIFGMTESDRTLWQKTGEALGHNISVFASDVNDLLNPSDMSKRGAVIQKYGDPLVASAKASGGPGSFLAKTAKGAVLSMAELPIQAISSITSSDVDEDGNVIPITPEKNAQNVQSMIGMVAGASVAKRVASALAPTEAAYAKALTRSYPGRLVQAAYPKAIAGLASGAAYGGTSTIGSEDQLATAISSALAFASLGSLWRPFKAASELKENALVAKEIPRKSSNQVAGELAATRGLQITSEDSPIDVAAKTKAVALSDDMIEAHINSNLTIGKQVILTDTPRETVDKVVEKLSPAKRKAEGAYVPSPEVQTILDNAQHPIGKKGSPILANIKDPFDKASVVALTDPVVMAELKKELKLTEPEIKSHANSVNENTKELAKDPANLRPRSPEELALEKVKAAGRGQGLTQNLVEGQTIKDINKQDWLYIGKKLTNGQAVLDPASPKTWELLGTDKNFNPNAVQVDVPKQNFNPEFGREISPKAYVYHGPNETHLVSSYELSDTPKEFFEKTGYLQNELVTKFGAPFTVTGKIGAEGKVQIKNMGSGKTSYALPETVRRVPNGVDSEFYKAENGEQLSRMGILNRETYMDNLYDKFKETHFKLDEEPSEPYNKTIARFANQMGMKNVDDITSMSREFYHRMVKDVLDEGDPHQKTLYDAAIKRTEEYHAEIEKDVAKSLANGLADQNMYLTSHGGGIYDISDKDGKILHVVKSLEEARDFVNKSGTTKGVDGDGGFSAAVPNIGGALKDTWNIGESDVAKKLSNWFNIKRANIFARTRSAVATMDGQMGTEFYPHWYATQVAQDLVHNFALNPEMTVMNDRINKAVEAGKGVPYDRRVAIEQSHTTLDNREIVRRFHMGPEDELMARQIASVGSVEIVKFLKAVKNGSLKEAIESGRFNKEVMNVGQLLVKGFDKSDRSIGAIALAKNLEFGKTPDLVLKPEERAFNNALKEAHTQIPGTDPIYSYIDYAVLADLTGHNPYKGYSNGFHENFLKTSTAGSHTELDPLSILHNFRSTAIRAAKVIPERLAYPQSFDQAKPNKMVSFNEIVRKARDYTNTLKPKVEDEAVEGLVEQKKGQVGATSYYDRYLNDVQGIPDLSSKLADASVYALKQMYGNKYKGAADLTRFATNLVYSSLLGLRGVFTMRDISNAHQNMLIYSTNLPKTLKAFGGMFDKELSEKLMADGSIPKSTGLDMVNPGEDLIAAQGRLNKLAAAADWSADWATKWNGQQLAHIRVNTGIFQTYHDWVAELSGEMLKNEKSKAKAYNELKIAKLQPTEQKFFDDLISAGRTDQAATFLGKTMVDMFNVKYGRNNAPLAWKGWFGRLAGGFGQWSVNQINTNISHLARGTRGDMIRSAAMMAGTNAAILAAGVATGVNLSRWTISPFAMPGISPTMDGMLGTIQDVENWWNLDPAISNPAAAKLLKLLPGVGVKGGEIVFDPTENISHLFFPGSFMIQNTIDSAKELEGDFGPAAAFQMVTGATINKSTISPLQQSMGLQPVWKDKVVPDRGAGPDILSGLNPFGGR